MNKLHFDFEIKRLRETFGQNAYPVERAALLFRELISYSDEWMTSAVEAFILESKKPPMLSDFKAYRLPADVAAYQAEKVEGIPMPADVKAQLEKLLGPMSWKAAAKPIDTELVPPAPPISEPLPQAPDSYADEERMALAEERELSDLSPDAV